jgi:hypothetical protein
MSRFNIARLLVLAGFAVGLTSFSATLSHIGDPNYLLPQTNENGATHAWYHALREVLGDVAVMAVVVSLCFAQPHHRNMTTWWICIVLAVGYYAPYWAGMPFNPALGAPSLVVEISHTLQALLVFAGLLTARTEFDA